MTESSRTPDGPAPDDDNDGCGLVPIVLSGLIIILLYISYKITEVEAFGKSPQEAAKVGHANWLDITAAALCIPVVFFVFGAANKSRVRRRRKVQQAAREMRAAQDQAITMDGNEEGLSVSIEKLDRSLYRTQWGVLLAAVILGVPAGAAGNLLLTHAYSKRKLAEDIMKQLHLTKLDLAVSLTYLLAILAAIIFIAIGSFMVRRAVNQVRAELVLSGIKENRLDSITDILKDIKRSSTILAWEFFIATVILSTLVNFVLSLKWKPS